MSSRRAARCVRLRRRRLDPSSSMPTAPGFVFTSALLLCWVGPSESSAAKINDKAMVATTGSKVKIKRDNRGLEGAKMQGISTEQN